jgi:hypothetical protein
MSMKETDIPTIPDTTSLCQMLFCKLSHLHCIPLLARNPDIYRNYAGIDW